MIDRSGGGWAAAVSCLGAWLLLAVVAGAAPTGISSDPAAGWNAKVDSWVLETSAEGETEFLVFMKEQADLKPARHIAGRSRKGVWVFETLRAQAAGTQRGVLQHLEALGVEYRPFWVANMIWVRGGGHVVETMASRPDVLRIHSNPKVRFDGPVEEQEAPANAEAVEWNLTKIGAPGFWAEGYTGQGAVIGGQDTGYDWEHPALKAKYRGWDGATATHDYNWHDAIHSGGSLDCGSDSLEPCDDVNHGTHTMGTMVGDDGGANQIGVAPGARWIGCRNMNEGFGTPATYSECFQFFLAPTDLNDENPDPAKAPHVVNNSWSCPPSEGCTDPNVLLTVVENLRAAGILVAVSAGNSGAACSTVSTPSAIYDASFTVGSTTSSDSISGFSSRGPVTVDGSGRLKPDISAPGSSVRSSVPGGGYNIFSGTSMAAPHVAGQVALLISASRHLAGDVSSLESCIKVTAVPKTSSQTCGGLPGSEVPNHTFGHGRIEMVWPLPEVCFPTNVFSDGFESGDFSAWSDLKP